MKKNWIPKVMGDTRREREAKLFHIFGPLRKALADIRKDDVDSIKGEPVLKFSGHYQSIAHTFVAVANVLYKVQADDYKPLVQIASKLHYGTPITLDEVSTLESYLNKMEQLYRTTPLIKLREASRQEIAKLGEE